MENNLAIGVDIGGTNIKAGLVSGSQVVGEIAEIPTPNYLEDFKHKIENIVSQLGQNNSDTSIPIGLGIPGIVDFRQSKIIHCPNLSYLSGASFSEVLSGYQISIGNDADMALLGEITLGNLWDQDVLLLTLGTGLGSAFYIGGKGSWELSLAGEAGHMKVVPDGKACGCGGKGCLEAHFSSQAIINEARDKISGELNDPESVFELARNGDDRAKSIIEQASKMLGIGIANLVNILGVSKVILGGKVSRSYELFAETVYESAKANIFAFPQRSFSIEQSKFVDIAAIVGAATFTSKPRL